jgi:flagellar hook-basal body complex protein FliE
MDVRATNAAAAYGARLVKADPGARPAADISGAGAQEGSFSKLLRSAVDSSKETLHRSEAMSNQALVNPGDLGSVVTAVASAEVTLQTVVAVRDRVVAAYQDILRMPI